MLKNNHQPFIMEITVISAQGLKNTSSTLLSHRLRPFITLTTAPPTSYKSTNTDNKHSHLYQTRVDDQGGVNPTWGDKFRLPLDFNMFTHGYSNVYLQLYTKRLMVGKAQLGWCQIPAADVLDGFSAAGSVRHLSYRLRARDGSRGHGVVNIAVKLESQVPSCTQRLLPASTSLTHSPEMGVGQTVIGIPVTMVPGISRCPAMCHGQLGSW